MLSHRLRDGTQANARKVVDGESRIFRIVHGEHLGETVRHRGIRKPLRKFLQSEFFGHLLHHNLDENTTRRRSVILVHLHDRKYGPRNRIAR